MMKKSLRILKLIFLISLIITLCFISTTYSKYKDVVNATYDSKLKRWNLKLNNAEVHNKTELTEFVEPVLVGYYNNINNVNDNINKIIASDMIAPGISGYLLFILDYSEVDVNFIAKFEIESLNENKLYFFDGKSYTTGLLETVDEEFEDSIESRKSVSQTPENKNRYFFEETVDVSKEKKFKYIKFYFSWNDETMDGAAKIENDVTVQKNKYDTDYALNLADDSSNEESVADKTLHFLVKATFTQSE